jgi:phenylacetate-CoA ligase
MDAAGLHPDDIQNVDDLAKIPVLSKDRFQELQQEAPPFGGFLAVPLRELQRIYLSPGPIYDPHGLDDADMRQAGVEALHEAGFTPDDIAINTFLYHMVPAGLLLDQILRDIGSTVVPMGPGNTDFQVKVILDLGITAYVGTPSFLQMIYDKAGEMGIDQLPLQKTFFSAEMYTPSQRALFEGEYGLRTAQAYATADLGVLAYERPGHSGLYIPQNLIMQICDPQTGDLLPDGEMGEVVVTSLNPAYPLIRFGTGDLSVMERESGDGSERRKLLGLMGRSGDAIKVRGMFLHPNALKGPLADFENIEKFQARVWREGSRDQVTLQLVLSGGSIDEQAVISAVQTQARLSINAVELVDAIDGSRLIVDTRSYD